MHPVPYGINIITTLNQGKILKKKKSQNGFPHLSYRSKPVFFGSLYIKNEWLKEFYHLSGTSSDWL